MRADVDSRISVAGHWVLKFREQGFHCSESVFLAVNHVLSITDPAMVRMMSGFHGGGGTHRTELGIDIATVLSAQRASLGRYREGNIPLVRVGHLCGALAAGMVCIGLQHGRQTPEDDLNCVDELCYELHQRFMKEFGAQECQILRQTYVPSTPTRSCQPIYRGATELAVELLLTASQLVAECSEVETMST